MVDGKRHGFGTFRCLDNILSYSGDWYYGKRHGKVCSLLYKLSVISTISGLILMKIPSRARPLPNRTLEYTRMAGLFENPVLGKAAAGLALGTFRVPAL